MDIKSLARAAMSRSDGLIDESNEPVTEIGRKAVEYQKELQDSKANFGYLTCVVVVYADSQAELKRNAEAVTNAMTSSKLVFIREREASLSSFAGGIPGNVKDPVRWFHVEASNVTDLAPLVTLDQGSREHPQYKDKFKQPRQALAVLRTKANTSYYFNNHVGERGHTLLVGPTRNGKTLFQMFLESQFLKYPNTTIINFDKDYSCEATTLMHGGELFDLTPGATSGLRMNPLAYLKSPGGVSWCAGWVDRLMALRGARLTDTELTLVTERLMSLKDLAGVRLNSLRAQLPGAMQERLAFWCEGGLYGEFFDNPDDELHFSTMTTFELGGLIARKENDVLRAFTDYVFFRIGDRFRSAPDNGDGEVGATNIYFEEAGFLLEDPLFEDRAVDYLMTLAKMNAHLTMTAQSPEAFLRSERLKAAVRDNIATVVFLPNDKANRGDLAKHYQTVFGVNAQHLELIAKATPKREYCIWQPQENHFRVAVASFPPEIVARLRSDKKTRKILNEMFDTVDPKWRDRYIEAVMSI
jgi:type IV secretory pathway VirB4 component